MTSSVSDVAEVLNVVALLKTFALLVTVDTAGAVLDEA
jgi:hypothetical protein